MKAYFEPKMNISVFDTENVVTTSGGINSLNNTGNFGTASYDDIKNGKIETVDATVGYTN